MCHAVAGGGACQPSGLCLIRHEKSNKSLLDPDVRH